MKMNQWIKWTIAGVFLTGFPNWAQAQKTPADIYRETSPAVVLIYSSHPESSTRSKGTGFIIGRKMVLTNAHVVLDEQEHPYGSTVAFLPSDNPNDHNLNRFKQGHKALVLFHDRKLDLALLISKHLPDVPPIPFGDSETVSIGDSVLAIGHPENGGLWSLTSGRIGSKIRNFGKVQGKHVFQAEASINHGNSGGPLLNMHGQMIGVITSMYRTASDGSAITGINFALQSQVAHEWLKSHDVAVALHPIPQAVSGMVVSSQEQSTISEKQETIVSALPSSTQTTDTDVPSKPEASQQNTLLPVQNILPPPGSPPKLLTPLRPFRDEDMFSQMMDKIDTEFDQTMEKMEKEFDEKMDKEFDSW